jgi:hypothetical protein
MSVLTLLAALSAHLLLSHVAIAQQPASRSSGPGCSSALVGGGPQCDVSSRLVIDLQRTGDGAPPELIEVVSLAHGGWAIRSEPRSRHHSRLRALCRPTR